MCTLCLDITQRKKSNGDGSGEWGDHSAPQCQLAADKAVPEVLAAVTPPRHWSSVMWCNSAPSGPQFMREQRDRRFECRLKQQIWSTCIRFFCNGDKACDEFSVAILRRTKICNFNTFFQSSAKASKVSRFEWNLHRTLLPTLRWARVKMRREHQKLRILFKISWVNFFSRHPVRCWSKYAHRPRKNCVQIRTIVPWR